MLHVVDDLLPTDLLGALRQLCLVHGELKQIHPGTPCSAGVLTMDAPCARSMLPSSDS